MPNNTGSVAEEISGNMEKPSEAASEKVSQQAMMYVGTNGIECRSEERGCSGYAAVKRRDQQLLVAPAVPSIWKDHLAGGKSEPF